MAKTDRNENEESITPVPKMEKMKVWFHGPREAVESGIEDFKKLPRLRVMSVSDEEPEKLPSVLVRRCLDVEVEVIERIQRDQYRPNHSTVGTDFSTSDGRDTP